MCFFLCVFFVVFLTRQQSNHSARRVGFDLTKESYYPPVIGKPSKAGTLHHDSIYNIYNSINISFHPPVLHACEIQIKQRLKRTLLHINWLKAEHMEVRTEGFLCDRRCFTFLLLPNDIGCEAQISSQAWDRYSQAFELLQTCWGYLRTADLNMGRGLNAFYRVPLFPLMGKKKKN